MGYAVPGLDFQSLMGAGALRSTANDLLKYVRANLGLPPSSLTPLMEKAHVVRFQSLARRVRIGLAWLVQVDPQGRKLVWHGGGTDGYGTFAGFDKIGRRGVVVLSNTLDFDVAVIGKLLLESEWQGDKRPKATKINRESYDSYAGQYRLAPDVALGRLALRTLFHNVRKKVIGIPVGFCLAALLVLLWRAANPAGLLVCAALVGGLVAALLVLGLSRVVCALGLPGLGIRRDGDRLFVQAVGASLRPAGLLLSIHDPAIHKASFLVPQITAELLPESDSRFFERLSGIPMTFSRDARGRVSRLTVQVFRGRCSFAKISDQPPKAPEPPQPRVAIKLDATLYDAYAGQYAFAPDGEFPTGIKLTIWRQGDQLVGQAWGENVLRGAFNICAESEASFFLTLVDVQLNFIRNEKGEATAVILRKAGSPDREGKRLGDLPELVDLEMKPDYVRSS